MWFAIIAKDRPDSLADRLAVREAHLEHIGLLQSAGRLLLAGPLPAEAGTDPGVAGFAGSIIIADFSSIAAAQDWLDKDPYGQAGIFESVEIQPFVQVLPTLSRGAEPSL